MEDRLTLKQREVDFFASAKAQYPKLFGQRTFIDTPDILSSIGIELLNQKSFPLGYIKLWPEDFIVEEIGTDGTVYTIERENLLSEGRHQVNAEDKTIYATLVKCGVSTLEAITEMARGIGCDVNQITYAGIKDKDAITAQRISFRNIPLVKIQQIKSSHFFLKDVVSGKGVESKGALQGNRFTILIRTEKNFHEPDKFKIFTKNIQHLKKNGFYNFYYLQRFGAPRYSNFRWGSSILKGEYAQAVYDFFTFSVDQELGFIKKIRKDVAAHWDSWDKIIEILEPMPLVFELELIMARYLREHPQDFLGALRQIPDQVMLWIYGISSFLFNRAISHYSKESKIPAPELPLFLSNKNTDWTPYLKELHALGIILPQFNNLRPFPQIQLRHRSVPTMNTVTFTDAHILPEGISLQFSLSRGSYATTMLAHLFTLASGFPPATITTTEVVHHEKTVEYFKQVIRSKFEDSSENTQEE